MRPVLPPLPQSLEYVVRCVRAQRAAECCLARCVTIMMLNVPPYLPLTVSGMGPSKAWYWDRSVAAVPRSALISAMRGLTLPGSLLYTWTHISARATKRQHAVCHTISHHDLPSWHPTNMHCIIRHAWIGASSSITVLSPPQAVWLPSTLSQ